jgi:putative permease
MLDVVKQWFRRYFSNPEASILLVCVVLGVLVIVFLGKIFAPILAGLVIAYLLESIINPLQRWLKFPRGLSVTIVFLLFVGVVLLGVLILLPLLWKQLMQIISTLPDMIHNLEALVGNLPKKYPNYVSESMVNGLLSSTQNGSGKFATAGTTIAAYTVNSLPSIFAWLVYLFLVPLLILFFLKDKKQMLGWFSQFIPHERGLLDHVGQEMKTQLGNYVRGKVIEMVLVTILTYIGFRIFNLHYAILLAFAVGLSTIIPYVGVVVITIPVAIIGLLQFGTSAEFVYMIAIYGVIQILDGNLLVPLLFSEAVNLHPVAIIAAVLFFGSVWGFWGLFFAIPLATLVKAVITAWMHHAKEV